ncbi:unnamed protein product [Rotaria sp. Silwood1]|nr:unnamed protein product [Rotaria sp. Silwood1]
MNDEARKIYLELIQTLYASDPIDHLQLAEYLTRLGRIDRRSSIFSQVLDHFRKVLPEQHPFILEVVDHLKSTEDTTDKSLPWIELSIVHQQRHIKRRFFVQQSDRINDIKVLLQHHFGISCNSQTIQDENECVLANDIATVVDYTLHSGAILRLAIDPEPEPWRIFVQSAMSMIEIADVYWWQSIYDIKCYLCDQSKLPPTEQQRLV